MGFGASSVVRTLSFFPLTDREADLSLDQLAKRLTLSRANDTQPARPPAELPGQCAVACTALQGPADQLVAALSAQYCGRWASSESIASFNRRPTTSEGAEERT